MKNLLLVAIVLGLGAISTPAALTLFEDFDSYTLGDINMQGEIVEYGFPVELWNTQANTSQRYGSGWGVVAEGGHGQCLKMTNRCVRHGDALNTVTTTVYFGEANSISSQGTVYLQYLSDSSNDCMLGLNGYFNGYATDVWGDPCDPDGLYQGSGAAPYSRQCQIVRLASDQNFRAYDSTGYFEVDLGLQSNTWYELWIQLDCSAMATRYYICEAGGTPAVVPNPNGGEWWGWRNKTTTYIMNLLVNQGTWESREVNTIVDNIYIDPTGFSTESFWEPIQDKLPGDANGDCTVDIQDFVILKQNYGTTTGATWEMGDFNGDGAVDIQDFVILKQNYGSSCPQ